MPVTDCTDFSVYKLVLHTLTDCIDYSVYKLVYHMLTVI